MPHTVSPDLKTVISLGGQVIRSSVKTWRLGVPGGGGKQYRLAQLDDFSGLARRDFTWCPPLTMRLRARASAESLPGTWGFGLWNDPFSLSLGFGGGVRRFPALPNAAWFFHASPPNYLSFRDDLPAQGFLAATFQSAVLPGLLLGLASPGFALLPLPPAARLFRRFARRMIRQDAALLTDDPAFQEGEWHQYQIDWQADRVTFQVDERVVLTSRVTPRPPLALVLWIDNQYAALPPNGRLSYGFLELDQPAWIEVADLQLDIP